MFFLGASSNQINFGSGEFESTSTSAIVSTSVSTIVSTNDDNDGAKSLSLLQESCKSHHKSIFNAIVTDIVRVLLQ